MNEFAEHIVTVMIEQKIISSSEFEAYKYSCIIFFEQIIGYGILLTIGLLSHAFLETILFLIAFTVIRRFSGGFHMNSFAGCLIASSFLELIFVKAFIPLFSLYYIYIPWITIIASLFILIVGAINNKNIHWTDYELLEAKQASRITVGILLFILLNLIQLDMPVIYILSISYGIILSSLLLMIEYIRQKYE